MSRELEVPVLLLKLVRGAAFLGLLLVLAVIWLVVCFRWTAVFFVGGWILALPFVSARRRPGAVRALWIGVLLLSLAPADISFRTRAGPPGLVPVLHGPRGDKSLVERAERGEVVLEGGGCFGTPYPATWVVVW